MKKNFKFVFITIIIMVCCLKLKQLVFISSIRNKYFVTINSRLREKGEIVIFNGRKIVYRVNARNISAILSIENGKIFYLETEPLENESFIVELDLKNKKIENKIKIPVDYEIYYAKKLENKVYFSDNTFLDSDKTNEKAILYEYDILTKEVNKVLDYNGQSLPIIDENEVIYSKENRIYIFDLVSKKEIYLFEGRAPFGYKEDKIFYIENNRLISNNKNGRDKKIIYKNLGEIGGVPVRIEKNIYGVIRLKEIPLPELAEEYSELELINAWLGIKENFYKIYYKKLNKPNWNFPDINNSSFLYIDKKNIKEYIVK